MAMKVGFIGAGGIAGAHMPNVAGREDTQIVAVCDINEQQAAKVAQQYGARPYGDYRKMLEAEDLDAAYVCLPPGAHGTIELDLAQARMPFCIEKPVNLDAAAAVKTVRAVRRKKLVTSVGYQVRYAPQVQKAREYVAAQRPSLVEGWFVGGMPGTPWWRVKAVSGGQAVEQTTHIFDLARYIVGEVALVSAFGSTGNMTDIESYDIEDASVAVLQFENGAVGHITSGCMLTEAGDRRTGLKVDGRSYSVHCTYWSLKIISKEGTVEEDHSNSLGPAMKELDLAFLNAAQTGDTSKVRCSYEDGLRSAAVSLAVNKSMETGKPVSPAQLLRQAGLR